MFLNNMFANNILRIKTVKAGFYFQLNKNKILLIKLVYCTLKLISITVRHSFLPAFHRQVPALQYCFHSTEFDLVSLFSSLPA